MVVGFTYSKDAWVSSMRWPGMPSRSTCDPFGRSWSTLIGNSARFTAPFTTDVTRPAMPLTTQSRSHSEHMATIGASA